MSQSENFSYALSKNNAIAVLVFSGSLSGNQTSLNEIEKCKSEVLGDSKIKYVVIDFSNVTGVGLDAFAGLTQFQKDVRSEKFGIMLCSFRESVKVKLTNMGVIRHAETADTLKTALIQITGKLKAISILSPSEKKAA